MTLQHNNHRNVPYIMLFMTLLCRIVAHFQQLDSGYPAAAAVTNGVFHCTCDFYRHTNLHSHPQWAVNDIKTSTRTVITCNTTTMHYKQAMHYKHRSILLYSLPCPSLIEIQPCPNPHCIQFPTSTPAVSNDRHMNNIKPNGFGVWNARTDHDCTNNSCSSACWQDSSLKPTAQYLTTQLHPAVRHCRSACSKL